MRMKLGTDTSCSPIFVVGCGRSGTTLLRLILNRHPDLAIFDESWAFFRIGKYAPLHHPKSMARFLRDWQQICAVASPFPEMMDAPALQSELRRTTSYAEAVAAVMGEFLRRENKTRWGEKTPGHVFKARQILSAYPNAKIIHITRDPRAAVNSLAALDDCYSMYYLYRMTKYWVRGEAAIDSAASVAGDRIMKVRYEDLIESPAESVGEICSFLGVRFCEDMLNTAETPDRYLPKDTVGAVRTHHLGLLQNVNSNSIDKWRRRLDAEAITMIETVAHKYMSKRGYAATSSSGDADASKMVRLRVNLYWRYRRLLRVCDEASVGGFWWARALIGG